MYAQVSPNSEEVVMSYSKAGYLCGLTFSYHLAGGEGVSLVLRTSSGTVLWSSPPRSAESSSAWEVSGLTDSSYLTAHVEEGVEFVLVSTSAGTNGSVALDDIGVNFCLPCNFGILGSGSAFDLSYKNYSRVYLRTPQSMQIQVHFMLFALATA